VGDFISLELMRVNFKKPDEVFFECQTKVAVIKLDNYDFNV